MGAENKERGAQMKQITIYEFLKRNADIMNAEYVAYDSIFGWSTFCKKPSFGRIGWDGGISIKDDFRITPFDGDWKDSLIKVEHKEE